VAARFLDRLGRGLRSPLVQALVLYAAFAVLAFGSRTLGFTFGPIMFGAALMTLFSIANPVSLVFVKRFWLNLFLSVLVWFALFLAITATIETGGRMREDGMIFLGAFTIFPVALFAAGIIRLVRRKAMAPAPVA
jgi:hypothetical protein